MAEPERTTEMNPADNPRISAKTWLLLGTGALLLVVITVVLTLSVISSSSTKDDGQSGVGDKRGVAIYYPLEPAFVVNFDVRGRQRFLQVDMTLLIRENGVVPAVELHMPAIRNTLVMLLSSQEYAHLQTKEGKEQLREEALARVREVLKRETGRAGVGQVLFTHFVMQ